MDLLTALLCCLGVLALAVVALAVTPLVVLHVQWRNFWQVLDREDLQLDRLLDYQDDDDRGDHLCPDCSDSVDEDDWR